MKKIIALFAIFFLLSCSDDSNTSFFELSHSSFELNKPRRTISVSINSNSSWVATDIPTWITLQQSNGTGNSDLQIEISKNDDPDGQTRTGTVKFISDNKVYLLTIVQTAVNEIDISILNNVVHNLDYNQHVFTIEVSSTKPWQLFNQPDWVQISPSTGNTGITSVELTILENVTPLARTGGIIFSTDPLNNNDNGYISNESVNIDQGYNTLMYAKTWLPITPLHVSDIDYNIDFARNKNSSQLFFGCNQSLIGGKTRFMSYNGSTWSSIGNQVYCSKPKLAVNNSGNAFVSYVIGSFSSFGGYACALEVSNLQFGDQNMHISPAQVNETDIAIKNNNPIVAYSDVGNGGKISVTERLGTNTWSVIGQAGFSVGKGTYCSIAVNSLNVPYVAYADFGLSNKCVVKKFNGINWVTVGVEGFSDGTAENIELVIAPNDDVYVAYKDISASGKITVKKFSSNSWQTIGTDGFSDNSVRSVSLAINNDNVPYIAYIESLNSMIIKKFNGTNWTSLNPIRIIDNEDYLTTNSSELKILIGLDNIPYIAFRHNYSSVSRTIIAKYLGS